MATLDLDGEHFLDNRLYLMHVARCTVSVNDGVRATTVHFADAPPGHQWCVLTRRNTAKWPPIRINHFPTEEAAVDFLRHIEPLTPLISLAGKSPARPLSYAAYCEWKRINRLANFDWTWLFPTHAKEGQVETLYERI